MINRQYFNDQFLYNNLSFVEYGKGFVEDEEFILIAYYADSDNQYLIDIIAGGWDKTWDKHHTDCIVLEDTHLGPFNNDDQCVICYDDIYDTTDVFCKHLYLSKCGHLFHRYCIEKWVNNNLPLGTGYCPICRHKIGNTYHAVLIEKYFSKLEITLLNEHAEKNKRSFSDDISQRLDLYIDRHCF